MDSESDRCAKARRFRAIDDAFREGDLDALRQAVGDSALVPNGDLGPAIGRCLVCAIYHGPLAFIRTQPRAIGVRRAAPVSTSCGNFSSQAPTASEVRGQSGGIGRATLRAEPLR